MNLLNFRPSAAARALCALALAVTAPAFAQHVLMQGPAIQVTDADVTADAATRISDSARATMLSRPATVQQLAANVYVQRAMAAEAERKGLAQGAGGEAILRLAREKALADLYWADFEKAHQPSAEAQEAYAQSTYRAAPDDVLKAPARVRVRHILLKGKTAENRAQLEQWIKQVQGGADFAALARARSEDDGSAAKGGDLGFLADGATVAPFEEAVKALSKPGELSPVVETQFGYHIIRLEERRPEGKRGFDEMRDQLLLNARATLAREARTKEIQRLQEGGQANQAGIDAYSARFKPAEGAR